jgi:gamma-glutamyl hydrolase
MFLTFKIQFFILVAFAYHVVNGRTLIEHYPNDIFTKEALNDYPIIGVLSQEQSYYLDGKFPGKYSSYIAASYVKFVEGGGARVVPIW